MPSIIHNSKYKNMTMMMIILQQQQQLLLLLVATMTSSSAYMLPTSSSSSLCCPSWTSRVTVRGHNDNSVVKYQQQQQQQDHQHLRRRLYFDNNSESSCRRGRSRSRINTLLYYSDNNNNNADDDDDDDVGVNDCKTTTTDDDSSVTWSGSSYSWKKPPPPTTTTTTTTTSTAVDESSDSGEHRRQRRRHRRDKNEHLPTIQTLDYLHCGTITIHQNPEDLDVDHDKDNVHQRTGVTLWSASYVLADYLDTQFGSGDGNDHGDDNADSHEKDNDKYSSPQSIRMRLSRRMPKKKTSTSSRKRRRRLNCVELGAGLGLPSIIAGKHGCNVIVTEHDPQVLPLLQQNIQENIIDMDNDDDTNTSRNEVEDEVEQEQQQVIKLESLDWTISQNELETTSTFKALETLGGADVIIMSDLIYNATQPLWSNLLNIVNCLRDQKRRIVHEREQERDVNDDKGSESNHNVCDNDNDNDPIVLLGYTQRRRDMTPDEEGLFFAMVKQQFGMEVYQIPFTDIPNSDKRIMTSIFQLYWPK